MERDGRLERHEKNKQKKIETYLKYNHRIMEWPGLKRTTVIMEFQLPCYVQGHQPPDQAAQSHIHSGDSLA